MEVLLREIITHLGLIVSTQKYGENKDLVLCNLKRVKKDINRAIKILEEETND